MKKSRRTRLTALMFAAAGVGCIATVCGGGVLYNVSADAATETTTTTCKSLNAVGADTTTSADVLPGDINGSGSIDSKDIRAFQNYLLGRKVKMSNDMGDLNGDGEIDVFDLAMLKRTVTEQQNTSETETTMPQPVYGPPEWFDTTNEEETTTPPIAVYGPPIWFDTTTVEEETTTEPQDVYGPPEWFDTTESDPEEETTTVLPQTEYGPPNWFTDPAEPLTTDPEETTTVLPQTEYGPPEWYDTTEPPTAEDMTETTMETLYGPPNIFN